MASINNWLGFSLSPQDQPQTAGFNSDESCFDLPSVSQIPSLNLPAPPLGILEAFDRNNHSQNWNVGTNTFSCSRQNLEDQNRPKLENFLGVHLEQQSSNSYQIHGNENSYIICQESDTTHSNGFSIITNWLRNTPAPPHAAEDKEAPTAAVQTLSLSMSTGSQSSFLLPFDNKLGSAAAVEGQTRGEIESVTRKPVDTFGQRTSIYRGVTRHRWTGRYEAHLWDNSCRREGQTRKGRQVYLGGYDKEDKAGRAYDLAALKYWGTTTTTNFPISNYEKEIEEMKHMTRQEYVASLRRKSSGFSRGASMYRGVTRHHQHGRWQARIGRVAGNKDLYLGTFSTEEEAAEAYDIAAIKCRGLNAVTNFEINRYDVKSILESSSLPVGGAARRLKDAEKAVMTPYGSTTAFQQPQSSSIYSYQRLWCKQENIGYNFLQPSVLHNIMPLDSSNMDGSTAMLMGGAVIVQDGNHQSHVNEFLASEEGKRNRDSEAMVGYQQARNMYYQSHQAPTNWISTASAANYMAACNEASAFTMWNDE